MKRKIGVIDLLFALLAYVCRMHIILIYEYIFYCGLILIHIIMIIFQIHTNVFRNSEI